MSVLCCIWFIVAFLWITITSALDKEWMIGGPVFFSLLAMAIYQNYCSRVAKNPQWAVE